MTRDEIIERIRDAFDRMLNRGLLTEQLILPPAWCAVLGERWAGAVIRPTHFEGPAAADPRLWDFEGGEPPRATAGPLFGRSPNLYEEIYVDKDDPNHKLTPTGGVPDFASEAFEKLVLHELKGTSPNRFARVGRVAELAQRLTSMYATRVGDAEDAEQMMHGEVGGYNYGQVLRAMPGMPARLGPPAADENDLRRDVMSTLLPLSRLLSLGALQQLRPNAAALGLDPAAIDAKLKELTAAVAVAEGLAACSTPNDSGGASKDVEPASNGVVLGPVTATATSPQTGGITAHTS